MTGKYGCVDCKQTRCARCCPALSQAKEHRKDEEALFLDQLKRPVLPPAPWETYYYETLGKAHAGCVRTAHDVCSLFSLPPPTRRETFQQTDADCGYCTIHHIEEESRRALGEPPWGLAYSQLVRCERVRAMRNRLVETGGANVAAS